MLQQIADISVFALNGEIDRFEAKQLLQRIYHLMQYRWSKIVLDFGEVAHVDYSIWRDLAALSIATLAQEGAIKLANLNSYHQRLLQVAGAESIFETYGSVADAVLSFHEFSAPAGTC